MVQWVKNPTVATWVAAQAQVLSPARHKGSGIAVTYVAGVAGTQSLARELPYAVGVAIIKKKKMYCKMSFEKCL